MYHLIALLISSAFSLCLVPVQVVLRLSQAWLHWRSHTLTQITHKFLTAVFHWDVIHFAALLSLFLRWGNSLLINTATFLKLCSVTNMGRCMTLAKHWFDEALLLISSWELEWVQRMCVNVSVAISQAVKSRTQWRNICGDITEQWDFWLPRH